MRDYYGSWIWETTVDPGFERLLWILDLRDYFSPWFERLLCIYSGFERLLKILDLRNYYISQIWETTIYPGFERLLYIPVLRDNYISWILETTIDPGFERILYILDFRDYYISWIWETTIYPGFDRLLWILDFYWKVWNVNFLLLSVYYCIHIFTFTFSRFKHELQEL